MGQLKQRPRVPFVCIAPSLLFLRGTCWKFFATSSIQGE